jgi:hypothetical protein
MFFLQISRKQSENSLSRINKIIEKHFLRNKASLQDMLLVPLASQPLKKACWPTRFAFSGLTCRCLSGSCWGWVRVSTSKTQLPQCSQVLPSPDPTYF